MPRLLVVNCPSPTPAEGSDAEEGKSSSRSKPPAQLSAGAAAKKKKAKQKAPLTPGGVNKVGVGSRAGQGGGGVQVVDFCVLSQNGKEVKKKPKEEPIRTRKPSRSSDKPPLAHPLPSSSSGEDQGRSLWSCSSSPWSDPYEVISTSRVSEQVKALVQLKAAQVKADAISMSKVGVGSGGQLLLVGTIACKHTCVCNMMWLSLAPPPLPSPPLPTPPSPLSPPLLPLCFPPFNHPRPSTL